MINHVMRCSLCNEVCGEADGFDAAREFAARYFCANCGGDITDPTDPTHGAEGKP